MRFVCFCARLALLCFREVGCGSAKKMNELLFSALALHYFDFREVGCGSA
ncbi:MAG: hypothetical protein IKI05_03525 [Bacteroidaceae bacterium]|nr:hypothetical protein [Bacteroidaceae bacterium]